MPLNGRFGFRIARGDQTRMVERARFNRDLAVPSGIPMTNAMSAIGKPAKYRSTTTARCSGSRCANKRSSSSRSAIVPAGSGPVFGTIGWSSTSIGRRRRRRMAIKLVLTRIRWSQASKRSGSRSRANRARPSGGRPGPRRVRARGPGRSARRSRPASRRRRRPARRRRHDRLPVPARRVLAGPRPLGPSHIGDHMVALWVKVPTGTQTFQRSDRGETRAPGPGRRRNPRR